MHTTALATCLILGSIQTIGLAAPCINDYNLFRDLNGADPVGLSTPKNSLMITFLVLSVIGVLFGLMVVANPEYYQLDAWKTAISVLTFVWLGVTLTTTILAMNIFNKENKVSIDNLRSNTHKGAFITAYSLVSLLFILALYYTFTH